MSYLIAGIGILSMWLCGGGRRARAAGFALGLVNQCIWVGYAVWTAQYGFIVGALVYGAVCCRNLWRLRSL
jgi:hypothetical protein